MSKKKFTTIEAAQRLMTSMEVAINNMIDTNAKIQVMCIPWVVGLY